MALGSSGWRHHLIVAQVARSRAFKEYLAVLRGLDFSSELPRSLISFFDSVNDGILTRLEALPTDAEFQSLRDDAAQTHLVRFSVLYRYLYEITSDLEQVETSRTIVEFACPLYRLVLPKYRHVRLLLHALPEVNYSWADLVSPLLRIAGELEIPIGARPPASKIWSIGFPGLQPGQTLAHTLLAHEVGHGVVQSVSMVGPLRRAVKIDGHRLDPLIDSAPAGIPRPPLRQAFRRAIRELLTEWLEEIACDVMAYDLTGPAYLFASIHLLPTLAELDSSSLDYPSVRLRLQLLFRLLKADIRRPERDVCDQAGYGRWFLEDEAAAFLAEWDEHVHSGQPSFGNDPYGVVGDAIDRAFGEVVGVVRNKGGLRKYDFTRHKKEIRQLVKRLAMSVPPNELDSPRGTIAEPACILNAGWIGYLSLVEHLCQRDGWDQWKARGKVEEWVAKGLELQEVQRRWAEVL